MDSIKDAIEMAERGLSILRGVRPDRPPSQYEITQAWDQLATAAKNVQYGAQEFGLEMPGR